MGFLPNRSEVNSIQIYIIVLVNQVLNQQVQFILNSPPSSEKKSETEEVKERSFKVT